MAPGSGSSSALGRRIKCMHPAGFIATAMTAAFCTYSCMYAFRKPFAVATFEDLSFWGIDYKILLITAQVLGYTLSKFLGIKIISELSPARRAGGILLMVLLAALAWLGFALVPAPWNIAFLFLNGLPLGMVWGMVFSFLEGRRTTEILSAGLSVSFIFGSGFVKTVGKWLILQGVSEYWMPLLTGLLFLPPLALFIWILASLPFPDEKDIQERSHRSSMTGGERVAAFLRFAPGLIVLILLYALLTAYRDFRDNFSAEIWQSLGYGGQAAIFTTTELPIALCILVMMSSLVLIRNSHRALSAIHLLILAGVLLCGVSNWMFEQGMLQAPLWMTLVGLGLYLAYVPFNSVLFDRLMAAFRQPGTAGFMIYLADSFGYLGSVGVVFYKNFGQGDLSWLQFFLRSGYVLSAGGVLLVLFSMVYFARKRSRENPTPTPPAPVAPVLHI